MGSPERDLGEEAVVARVSGVIADAAIERRHAVGDDARRAARRVALEIATGILRASRPDVAAHSDDVQIVAAAIARWLGISGQRLDDIAVAARLHDIGKLALPDVLLEMREPLGPIEWVAIRRHTIVGEQILIPVPELRGVAKMVRSSHERWDGFGYPDGLAGEAIPLGSRIVACADAFVSMRSDRPYRRASTTAEALDEIRACARTQFDPDVVEALAALADGLRIAADRSRPKPAAGRLLALLLIVSVGATGAALARTGAIPEASRSEAETAPVRSGSSAAVGGRVAPPALASSPLALRPRHAPNLGGTAIPSRNPFRLDAGAHPGPGTVSGAPVKPQGGPADSGSHAPPQSGQPVGTGQGAADGGPGNGHGQASGQGKANGGGKAGGKGHAVPPGHAAHPATPPAGAGGAAAGPNGAAKPKPKPHQGAAAPSQGAGHANAPNGNWQAGPPGKGKGHN